MGLLKEFREFAVRGNVIDMAVGIIIGAAFGEIVNTLVKDVMMPPIGMLMSGVDFSQLSLQIQDATFENGKEIRPAVDIRYGVFLNSLIRFVIVAFAVFLLVKGVNQLRRQIEKPAATAAPPEPPAEVKLLGEIRDLLKQAR